MIKELEKTFAKTTSELKGFTFTQIMKSNSAYVYKIDTNTGSVHYEVFLRKTTPICIDFEKRIYSDTDFKEIYPKSKDFGKHAWCIRNKEKAIKRFNEL